MKALVYKGPETLGYEEAADPVAGPDAPVIRVESAGITGARP